MSQVFWPLDADWYPGSIVGYDSETNKHQVGSLQFLYKKLPNHQSLECGVE